MSDDVVLGCPILEHATPERDAVHIAVIPLIAGETLCRGQRFIVKDGTAAELVALDGEKQDALGIVDPFLSGPTIERHSRFWGLLFPGTISGMRHHWSHPAIATAPPAAGEHELWLRTFCVKWRIEFSQLREAVRECLILGDGIIVAEGRDIHSIKELDPGEEELFWFHLERYLDQEITLTQRRGLIWSCSC